MRMKKYGIVFIMLMLVLLPAFKASADSGGYMIKIRSNFPLEQYQADLKEINAEKGLYALQNGELLDELSEYIETAAANDKVSLIEDFKPVSLYSEPEDKFYSQMWQLDMINITAAWDLETYGNGIRVAVIDSGCYPHDDLKSNLLTGKNYFDKTEDVSDNDGHGTHVAGIIAAEMNDMGVVGIAPKAKIVPLKCFDPSKQTGLDMIIGAIYDAVDVYGCKIINMSWGTDGDNPFLREAIKYAYDKGVILVAAVGNSGSDALYYPAAYDYVIGVGAVTPEKAKASFSQYNEAVFVVAPGLEILSTYNDGGYIYYNGTSQAAPMVAGLAAVMLSMDDDKTSADFRQLLLTTSEDLGDTGYDTQFGYGLINTDSFIKTVLQDKQVYISPLSVKDDVSGVYYFNLTDKERNMLCIKAYYDNLRMDCCTSESVTLSGNESFVYECTENAKDVKYMAWDKPDSLAPLGKVRVIEN